MQKLRNRFASMGKKLGLAGAALASYVDQCMAAVPADVTAALTDGKADAMTVAGLALVILIGIAVFKYMRRGV